MSVLLEYWWVIVIVIIAYWLGTKRKHESDSAKPQPLEAKKEKKRIGAPVIDIPVDFQLTKEFSDAFDRMESTRNNIFITGKAGTGKSTLLHYFKKNTKKNIIVVAPTGVAAYNVGGVTAHSFFSLPIDPIQSDDQVKVLRKYQQIFEKLDAVVIDEVSMVRADLMDGIDVSLRKNRQKMDIPFGNVQMLVFGDPYQLPPVITSDLKAYFHDKYGGGFFFNSKVVNQNKLPIIELKQVFRQKDAKFISLLDSIRLGRLDSNSLNLINSRVGATIDEGRAITLTSTNNAAALVNSTKLQKLEGREYRFDADISGSFDIRNKDRLPADMSLTLKIGAQIMMLRNDQNKKWVNGTIGIVEQLSRDSIFVDFGDEVCKIDPVTWEDIEYEYDRDEEKIIPVVKGSFRQYPIRLAWAVTIHKSQGKTFDKVIIDLGTGAFAHGQAYVALSRCTSFEGITLRQKVKETDLIIDPIVRTFMGH